MHPDGLQKKKQIIKKHKLDFLDVHDVLFKKMDFSNTLQRRNACFPFEIIYAFSIKKKTI